jgi:VWFA-related protein
MEMNSTTLISAAAVSTSDSNAKRWLGFSALVSLIVIALSFMTIAPLEAKTTNVVTMTVTVEGAKGIQRLSASQFVVTDNGQLQNIDVVEGPQQHSPPHVAIVLEEGSATSINNQLSTLREFVEHLPQGTQVMVATIDRNHSNTVMSFSTDLKHAAQSIPMIVTYKDEVPLNTFVSLSEVIKKFEGLLGRKEIVMIGTGFDVLQDTIDPLSNMDLQHAEARARDEDVVIHTIWIPAVGVSSEHMNLLGASNLSDLSETTGGLSFWNTDRTIVQDLASRLNLIQEAFDQQYILRFSPDIRSKSPHRIKVALKDVPNGKAVKVNYPAK